MTTAALAPSIDYLEDGATLAFPVPFRFLADTLAVSRLVDGVETALTAGSAWSATGGASDAGGTVTLAASVAGATLRIRRRTPRSQQADYATNDTFPAETHEAALDKAMLIAQETDVAVDDLQARAVTVAPGELPLGLVRAGLTDGDLLEYRNGQLQRLDTAAFAGMFYAGGPGGRPIPASGLGSDPALRVDLANPLLGASLIAIGLRSLTAKILEIEVSIRDFMAGAPDGAADNTAALQAAIDSIAAIGGVVKIPRAANPYRIDMVTITTRHITIRLEPGTVVKKFGLAGIAKRGIVKVANLLAADFVLDLNGGTIDLNGEGPIGIGVPGRIPNNYAPKTVASITCIAGPANAALYGLRSTGIKLKGPGTIKNTGEVGVLFRNCGDCEVDGVAYENITDWGVEIGIVSAGVDGGTGTMPARDNMRVRNCSFTDINDRGVSSGNGGGIGGGGTTPEGAAHKWEFTNNRFERCYRDIHFELTTGTWIDGLTIDGVQSKDAGQGSIGLIGVRNGSVNNAAIANPGWASVLALTYQIMEAASPGSGSAPESTGIVLSTDFSNIKLGDNITIVDGRSGGVVYRTDGVAVQNDPTFTSAGAVFTADDVGKPIGIIGAGPGGTVVHETFIASLNGPAPTTSVELQQAPNWSVTGAKFAYGGGLRDGILITQGTSATVGNLSVEAGAQFGMAGEPSNASAIRIRQMSDYVSIGDVKLTAPANGTSHPAGIRVEVGSSFTGLVQRRPTYRATGFARKEVGTFDNRILLVPQTVSTPMDRAFAPSALADTYGAQESLGPSAAFFSGVLSGSFETVGALGGGETITYRLTANYFDSGSSTITLTATAIGVLQLTAKQILALNPEGGPIRSLVYDMKSSAAASAASGKANLTALQA